jgi:hypothetical protein
MYLGSSLSITAPMTIPGGSVVGRSCDKDELGKNYEKTMNTLRG